MCSHSLVADGCAIERSALRQLWQRRMEKTKSIFLHIKWHELSSSIILSNIFHLEYFEIYRMSDFSDGSQCG